MLHGIRMAAMAGVSAVALTAAAGAQTLTMAVGAPVTSLDPHYHQLSPNNAVSDMIFSKLVETDAQARNVPGLALEWRAVGPTVWEFKLRPNVRFHNGQPSSFAAYARPIQRIEIVDPLTIRFHTASPYPLMPLDMTNVRIISAATDPNPTTEGFNAGRNAIGTGPFRVAAHRQGEVIEFERNAEYFEGASPFQRVSYRMITNDATRTAALLAGNVDFIDQVPTTDLARLRNDQRLHLSETVGLRLIFLGLDHLRAENENSPQVTDNDGRPLGRNPLRDVRVRRALSMAIDRAAITSRIMDGAATPANQFLPPGTFSHVADLPPIPFDPDGARRLLAEAGYPNGFRIQLNSPNDRYINDARIAQAVGQMWSRIGVRTAVEAQTWATFVGRAGRQEFSAHLIGWGSNPDGSHPMRNIIGTANPQRGWGASNRGRYSNPQLDEMLLASLSELDEAKRERMLIDIQRMAAEDVAVIPLHIQTNIWAMRRNLTHSARVDELTRAQDVRPATMR